MKPTQFIKRQHLLLCFKEKVLPYLTDEKSKIKLKEYILPKYMNDTSIKTTTNSTPIDVKYFASILHNHLKTANKNKYYIFHIKTPKKIVAVRVDWFADVWFVYAFDFDYGVLWDEGFVFLFPATDTLDLDTRNSDPLVLETRIKKLEDEVASLRKFLIF